MCLILLKDEFLLRNGTLTRLALEGDKKAFWTMVADLFNSANTELDALVGNAALLERYKNLGLSPIHTGYQATAEKCESEFKSYRSAHTKAQVHTSLGARAMRGSGAVSSVLSSVPLCSRP